MRRNEVPLNKDDTFKEQQHNGRKCGSGLDNNQVKKIMYVHVYVYVGYVL